jgi:hypothetical protein
MASAALWAGWAASQLQQATDAYEDAYGRNAQSLAARGRLQEHMSWRERESIVAMGISQERQQMRQARALKQEMDDVVNFIRTCHRGIDETRRDLHAKLRQLAWESSLDR